MIYLICASCYYFVLQAKFNSSEKAYRQLREEGSEKDGVVNSGRSGADGGGDITI